jgi:hypothetical protein
MNNSPPRPDKAESSQGSTIYKQAKSLFTKKFSLKLGSKNTAGAASQSPSREDTSASKVKKFTSNIPGTKTSKTGLAYYPEKGAASQSPTSHKHVIGTKPTAPSSNLASSRPTETSPQSRLYAMNTNAASQQKKMFKFNINNKHSANSPDQSPVGRLNTANSAKNLPNVTGSGVRISELNRMSPTPSIQYNRDGQRSPGTAYKAV